MKVVTFYKVYEIHDQEIIERIKKEKGDDYAFSENEECDYADIIALELFNQDLKETTDFEHTLITVQEQYLKDGE
jgi:hypothetical protein